MHTGLAVVQPAGAGKLHGLHRLGVGLLLGLLGSGRCSGAAIAQAGTLSSGRIGRSVPRVITSARRLVRTGAVVGVIALVELIRILAVTIRALSALRMTCATCAQALGGIAIIADRIAARIIGARVIRTITNTGISSLIGKHGSGQQGHHHAQRQQGRQNSFLHD